MFNVAEKKCECVIGAEVTLCGRRDEKTHELRAVGKCTANVKLLLTADACGNVWQYNGKPLNKCKPVADCRRLW